MEISVRREAESLVAVRRVATTDDVFAGPAIVRTAGLEPYTRHPPLVGPFPRDRPPQTHATYVSEGHHLATCRRADLFAGLPFYWNLDSDHVAMPIGRATRHCLPSSSNARLGARSGE